MTTWTETPPTKPGYYWWRYPEIGWSKQVVEVFEAPHRMLRMQQFGCAADKLTGEWGPEIVLQDDKEDRALEALIVQRLRGKCDDEAHPPLTAEEKQSLKSLKPGFIENLLRKVASGSQNEPKGGE